MIQGKQETLSLRTSDQTQAESNCKKLLELCQTFQLAIALERLFGVAKDSPTDPQETTIKTYLEYYDQFCKETEKAPSLGTQKQVKNYINLIANKTDCQTLKDLENIGYEKLRELYPNPNSYNAILRQMKSAFKADVLKWLRTKGINIKNPFADVLTAKPKIEPYKPMEEKMKLKMLKDAEKLPDNLQLLMLLGITLGTRRNEADKARLNWLTKFGKDQFAFTIKEESDFKTKSRQTRQFPISKTIYNKILKLRGNYDSEYLVPSNAVPRKGRKESKGNYRLHNEFEELLQWLKQYGVTYHNLRAECGSYVATQFSMESAQKILGHSSITVTQSHYASLLKLPTLG